MVTPSLITPMGLNPYSNGMYIKQIYPMVLTGTTGLNPYSNGMKIECACVLRRKTHQVLILVVME